MAVKSLFSIQKPMLRVCYALIPIALISIYLFGWRSLFLIAIVFLFGITAEAAFTHRQGNPITSAVFVTCLIFSLSLPPTIPIWIAVIGIVSGVVFGKMVFGGFGQNIFNPAMVGRCFIYITFPGELTNKWVDPIWGGVGGFAAWTPSVDAITGATPLAAIREGVFPPLYNLFIGDVSGSLGETSVLLIVIGGIYIIYRKAASWRLAFTCLIGGILMSGVLQWNGLSTFTNILYAMFSGSFLFGCAFVVTEPVSGAKTRYGQLIYGFLTGCLTMILRQFSNFSEGFMFAVLLMNAFVPLIDHLMAGKKRLKADQ